MSVEEFDSLFESQNEQIQKLHQIVEKAVDEEKLITDNLLNPPREVLKRGQRISDKVARFGGSWTFIIIFLIILIGWIAFNSLAAKHMEFDPFPFILMNLVLSCIAAFQAPIIMMSQNRQEEKDRKRAENDYMINMKAELEVRSLHQKMDLLLEEQIKTLFDIQARQMKLLNEIKERLGNG